jgi:hypothetical protein
MSVHPSSNYQRLRPRPERPSTFAQHIRNSLEGIKQNVFLREEVTRGNWQGGQRSVTYDEAWRRIVAFVTAAGTHGLKNAPYPRLHISAG